MSRLEFHGYVADRVRLRPGDCLEVLAGLPENSVDSVVCDPPYHLHSIVKRFAKTGRTESTSTKSGPHQRTATGFMGKQWDGGDIAFQPETWRQVIRVLKPGGYIVAFSSSRTFGRMSVAIEDAGFITHPMIGWIFGSGFPKATRIKAEGYDGFRYGGQALKPALEPIYMGQRPFSEVNGTENVLRWGTGAVNVDGCRVASGADHAAKCASVVGLQSNRNGDCYGEWVCERDDGYSPLGRWPANLILSDDPEVIASFPDQQHRFFYQAKANKLDRSGSRHPTVKPVNLMRYLVRLVTPPGGLVLDPFAGSGTTGAAAYLEGMRGLLIERETEYQDDIECRLAALCETVRPHWA